MNPRPKKNYIGNGALKFGWEDAEVTEKSAETTEALAEEIPF